jgi:hypothetical protein
VSDQIDDPKRTFLDTVFLSNTQSASFVPRNGRDVYRADLKAKEREPLGKALQAVLHDLARGYATQVQESSHINNIEELRMRLTNSCSSILNEDTMMFGVAQKALNTYLKFVWCQGRIVTPPHCPFDKDVIDRLQLPADCEKRWTYASTSDYENWVTAAKRACAQTNESLAHWELRVWREALDANERS